MQSTAGTPGANGKTDFRSIRERDIDGCFRAYLFCEKKLFRICLLSLKSFSANRKHLCLLR